MPVVCHRPARYRLSAFFSSFIDTSTCILYLLSFCLLNLVNLQQAHQHYSYNATY